MSQVKRPLLGALGELALIFFGITLALAFESWNDARVERNQERELLVALRGDLEETLTDLRRDISDSEATLASRAEILAWQGGEQLSDMELQIALSGSIAGSGLFPKVAAYESIKTIGLDLIDDPLLRDAVTSLHELTLARALRFEALRDEFEGQVLLPMFRRKLDYAGDGQIAEIERQAGTVLLAPLDRLAPLDPQGLRDDSEFRIVWREGFSVESNNLASYRRLEREIESVVEMIGTAVAS